MQDTERSNEVAVSQTHAEVRSNVQAQSALSSSKVIEPTFSGRPLTTTVR